MFLKFILKIVEDHINVLVLISQVAALNWSDTIYPNLGYSSQKTPKIENFCTKIDLKVILKIVMFLKLMLEIVDAFSNILVLISHVAALNWSYTIYPNLEYPR